MSDPDFYRAYQAKLRSLLSLSFLNMVTTVTTGDHW
jgi:hypothetical protein